ncbi:uncharacterized protein LOC124451702 [Xenia sp. Carnegie-2017]|uniref:uncharacterized protein LOC124451702 n=1 Tax=Xenia sp. Carnegie-2017 TaxID=2897299 RepID=UPI001F04976E|nr:uncharacterized protein LOC124451702 [Xenia sp. Carnegie-2017]
MEKFGFLSFVLFCWISSCQGVILSPPPGTSFTFLPGGTENITWTFDDDLNDLASRNWLFTGSSDGSQSTLLAIVTLDLSLINLNEPILPNYDVSKPSTLQLRNITHSYDGTYEFRLARKDSLLSPFISKVRVFVAIKPNALINCSTPLVVSKGDNVSCVCRGEGGIPPANVTWFDKDNNIIGDVGVVSKTLVITNVTLNGGGNYTCKAQSCNDPRFKDEKSIEVTVKATYNVLCDDQKERIKQCKTEWYIILITLTSGIIVGILVSILIVFQYRRHWFSKNCQQFQSPSEVRKNSVDTTYQELDLSKINNKEDNYQSLRPKDDTVDKTYQELDISKMNIEDNNYESLQKNNESEYVIADEKRNYENSNLF